MNIFVFRISRKGGVPGTIEINDFQKTPKGASLAPSGFGFYNVWWYQIHRDPSWDLYCKVRQKSSLWLPDY